MRLLLALILWAGCSANALPGPMLVNGVSTGTDPSISEEDRAFHVAWERAFGMEPGLRFHVTWLEPGYCGHIAEICAESNIDNTGEATIVWRGRISSSNWAHVAVGWHNYLVHSQWFWPWTDQAYEDEIRTALLKAGL